jgi:hypothetical protein
MRLSTKGLVADEGIRPTLVVAESLPDTGPEDVTIVTIHHYPLPVKRILVHGAGDGRGSK